MQPAKERSQIPALKRATYLDNAGAGLPPVRVTNAMKRLIDDWSRSGEHWDEWLEGVVEARRLFGKLVGGVGEEVGVVPSASAALASVASALDLSKRKKVVVSALNFPTNIILWQRMRESGLLRTVEVLEASDGAVPIEAYEKAVDEDTAAVAVDYVSWLSGAREDIKAISDLAHRNGALMIVDSFHGLGVFPLNAKRDGIDVLVNGFYKWLSGPHGVAGIYVDRGALNELRPAYMGWHGVRENVVERMLSGRDQFDVPFPLVSAEPSATAARFEWGTWATSCVAGAIEAMKFTIASGATSRYRRIAALKGMLQDGLSELELEILTPPPDKNPGAGIVTFVRRRHGELVRDLARRRIVVSGRFGHVRVSPHFYNTEEEVETLLDALREAA